MEWKEEVNGTWQQRRLPNQLTVQARQLERVMAQHRLPAQVSGGSVRRRQVSFDIQSRLTEGMEWLRLLKNDVFSGLGQGVQANFAGGRMQVQLPRQDVAVPLLKLLDAIADPDPVTAVLGIAEDDRPVLLDFHEGDISNVLVCGVSGSGKTALLRAMAVSLALANRQSQLQLLLFQPEVEEPDATSLALLDYLPHVLTTLVSNLYDAEETIQFLLREMAYRQEQETHTPTIVVMIDRLVSLFESGSESLRSGIAQLLQSGADAGFHFVLSTSRPEHELLGRPLSAHFPLRLVGQVANSATARVAAGRGGSQAEYLLGAGDFLAVTDGGVTRFQAAFIDDYDLHLSVSELHRRKAPALLARPVADRRNLQENEQATESTNSETSFQFDGDRVVLDIDANQSKGTTEFRGNHMKEILS